jgi:hypothetical protein
MTEPWTPGPWHTKESIGGWTDVLTAWDTMVARFDDQHPREADLRVMVAAPEMAALLNTITTHPRASYSKAAAGLLSRIRGEA